METPGLNESNNFAETEPAIDFEKMEQAVLADALQNNEFDAKKSDLVKQFLAGSLKKQKKGEFDLARNEWWRKKFGFSYFNEELRNNLLSAKEKFAENQEAFEVLSKLPAFFETQKQLDKLVDENGLWNKKMREMVVDITKFRAQIGKFIEVNSPNEETCRTFWETVQQLAASSGNEEQIQNLRKATLSQVAVTLGFKEIGCNPAEVDPGIDAFKMIDIKVDADKVIQIKTGDKIQFVKSDRIASTGVGIKEKGKVKVYHVDGNRFTANVQDYESWINEGKDENEKTKVDGWLVMITPDYYSWNTGKPIGAFVDELREHFAKK
jgi:ASC-1-like (ASCH) protein